MLDKILTKATAIGMTQHPSEIADLATFVQALGPRNVMEIGCDRGGSFYLWSQLASGKKIALDLPAGRFCCGLPLEHYESVYKAMPTWADDVHVILGDSHSAEIVQQVYSLLDGDKLDFLFIDGDHTYEGVKKDYLVYRRCVRSGGWIGFHDINDTTLHRDHHCLVAKLWSELEGKKIAMTIGDEWGGIGVVQVP